MIRIIWHYWRSELWKENKNLNLWSQLIFNLRNVKPHKKIIKKHGKTDFLSEQSILLSSTTFKMVFIYFIHWVLRLLYKFFFFFALLFECVFYILTSVLRNLIIYMSTHKNIYFSTNMYAHCVCLNMFKYTRTHIHNLAHSTVLDYILLYVHTHFYSSTFVLIYHSIFTLLSNTCSHTFSLQ